MTSPSDQELIDRLLRSGDSDALGLLYDRHTSAMYAVAIRLTGSQDDASDFVHDAWIRATDRMATFRGAAALRTWLVGIVINRCREARRVASRREVDLEEGMSAVELPMLPRNVDSLDLTAAISAMPPGYREVIVLHDVEGFTHQDIATMLGIDPGTSKSQLARGRAWLRRALREEDQ